MLGRKGGGAELRGALQSSDILSEVQKGFLKFRETQ